MKANLTIYSNGKTFLVTPYVIPEGISFKEFVKDQMDELFPLTFLEDKHFPQVDGIIILGPHAISEAVFSWKCSEITRKPVAPLPPPPPPREKVTLHEGRRK